MNYLHAFHAGNHSEVFKHAVLTHLIVRLREKPKPFFILDTHAGEGLYDLSSKEALRTREFEEGVARVIDKPADLSKPYLDLVRPLFAQKKYPGSPMIAQSLLREGDRLVLCELSANVAARLKSQLGRRASIHARDGYEAMVAFVPPRERRGLVFCDPTYESPSELVKLAEAFNLAMSKWPTGIYMAWYPIKGARADYRVSAAFSEVQLSNCLVAEFIPYPDREDRLAGSGLAIWNPPWKLAEELRRLSAELMSAIGVSKGRWSVIESAG